MHHLVALFAGCLLYPGSAVDPCRAERKAQYEFLRNHPADKIEWSDNGSVRLLKNPVGIVLPSGVVGIQIDQPARELLEKIGPALLARGTEELRPFRIDRHAREGTIIKCREFIRGREVRMASVSIVLNEKTNEVTMVSASFLPDRGLQHQPQLNAAEARKRVEAELREIPYQEMNPSFDEVPARLAYAFEQWGSEGGGLGGALVWVFPVTLPPAGGEGQFGELTVDAATGKITPRDNVLRYWDR